MATDRDGTWSSTMHGYGDGRLVVAHANSPRPSSSRPVTRTSRTQLPHSDKGLRARPHREQELVERRYALRPTIGTPAGTRARPEDPDPWRTCFEKDRDRILHSNAFRRLAGKTQVFIFPSDHQRTRLTHALEVAQVARAAAAALGLNEALAEAIALGHDCGHGPGGHASEDAFSDFLLGGFDHAPWGADVTLVEHNLCAETLDGIRHHSWSLPAPATPEGEIVSWADRIAYLAHDFEDAVAAGIISIHSMPTALAEVIGTTRSQQIETFVTALVETSASCGVIAMDAPTAAALGDFRQFNRDRIYCRPSAEREAKAVIAVLSSLVEAYADRPYLIKDVADESRDLDGDGALHAAVRYVAGMTDRFAMEKALELGWDADRLPRGLGGRGRRAVA